MKKIGQCLLILIMFLSCCPMMALAAGGGTTDIYVGVTTVSKSNMHFLIVDEDDQPIDGASIDLWANDELGYQLLGVSHDGGIYETILPYGDYPYKVYKNGYETEEQVLYLPNKENPHVEKVVLKKEQPKTPGGGTDTPGGNQGSWLNKVVKTGDQAPLGMYFVLTAGAAALLVILGTRKKRL